MKNLSDVAGSLNFHIILIGYLYISCNKRLHFEFTNYFLVNNQHFTVIYAGKLLIQWNLDNPGSLGPLKKVRITEVMF